MGEWPTKVGGVQDRLTDVEVKGLARGLLGGSGGLITVTLAEDETTPILLATVHVYVPSSSLSTICILRMQLSSPRLVNARSMFSGRPSLLHSTAGGGRASALIRHLSCTERSTITVLSERGLTMRGACKGEFISIVHFIQCKVKIMAAILIFNFAFLTAAIF